MRRDRLRDPVDLDRHADGDLHADDGGHGSSADVLKALRPELHRLVDVLDDLATRLLGPSVRTRPSTLRLAIVTSRASCATVSSGSSSSHQSSVALPKQRPRSIAVGTVGSNSSFHLCSVSRMHFAVRSPV